MKTITLKNGKSVDVEFRNNSTIKILNSFFELRKMGNEFVLNTLTASKELADFFAANVEKKPVSLRIEESVYFELKSELESFTQKNEAEKQEKRKSYIATRPQSLVLMFSGWYLSDTPEIVTLFHEDNGEQFKDKQGRWYVSESHQKLTEIRISDATALSLQDAQTSTDFESRCFLLTDEQVSELIRLNNARIAEKENIKLQKEEKESERRNSLIAEAKKTGKKQILSQFMDECDNSVPDCSFDQIITWIDSEGKISTTRSHCH